MNGMQDTLDEIASLGDERLAEVQEALVKVALATSRVWDAQMTVEALERIAEELGEQEDAAAESQNGPRTGGETPPSRFTAFPWSTDFPSDASLVTWYAMKARSEVDKLSEEAEAARMHLAVTLDAAETAAPRAARSPGGHRSAVRAVSEAKRRGPGQPRVGTRIPLTVPDDVLADAQALADARGVPRARVLREWLRAGRDASGCRPPRGARTI